MWTTAQLRQDKKVSHGQRARELSMILIRFILHVRVRRFYEWTEWEMKGHFHETRTKQLRPVLSNATFFYHCKPQLTQNNLVHVKARF